MTFTDDEIRNLLKGTIDDPDGTFLADHEDWLRLLLKECILDASTGHTCLEIVLGLPEISKEKTISFENIERMIKEGISTLTGRELIASLSNAAELLAIRMELNRQKKRDPEAVHDDWNF